MATAAVVGDTGVKDIKGRTFGLPVDTEHKATACGPTTACMIKEPHMHTFWGATFGFFTTFFSCFAPSALGTFYKRPASQGGLGLSPENLSDGGAFAVSGTIIMRIIAGPMCDVLGARLTFVTLLLVGIPGMIIFSVAQGPTAFILGRVIIGLSLATFVTCQVWCSQFFSKGIVGTVNATAGGWGNLGGAITLLVMPSIVNGFIDATTASMGNAKSIDFSWRMAMIIPACMHLITATYIFMARDLPDGSYKELEAAGVKQKSKGALGIGQLLALGFSNTNALIMLVTYGLCFGVELCMNNKLSPYFTRYYGMHPTTAGPLAACFGLMNIFARSWGGILSDYMMKKSGLRGRIWAMWVIQTIEGLFCMLMGMVTVNLDSPDEPGFKDIKSQGQIVSGGVTYTIDGALGEVGKCASEMVRAPEKALAGGVMVDFPIAKDTLIMIKDASPTCICNNNTLAATMILMICFSICVQMAEGLHYGIVPYISRPALGVCSGMVGAGGNLGALISSKWVVGARNLDRGFINLGIGIMGISLIMHGIFFPGQGGMLLPASFPYNPQLIKEQQGQKGSDELDFSAVDRVDVTLSKNEKEVAQA